MPAGDADRGDPGGVGDERRPRRTFEAVGGSVLQGRHLRSPPAGHRALLPAALQHDHADVDAGLEHLRPGPPQTGHRRLPPDGGADRLGVAGDEDGLREHEGHAAAVRSGQFHGPQQELGGHVRVRAAAQAGAPTPARGPGHLTEVGRVADDGVEGPPGIGRPAVAHLDPRLGDREPGLRGGAGVELDADQLQRARRRTAPGCGHARRRQHAAVAAGRVQHPHRRRPSPAGGVVERRHHGLVDQQVHHRRWRVPGSAPLALDAVRWLHDQHLGWSVSSLVNVTALYARPP